MIDEGMREEEVKRLCDVHVEVFKESLEDNVIPGLPAGHPVHTYMHENRAAENIILKLQAIHDIGKENDTLVSGLKELSKIDLHYTRKENQLFPVLEAHGISDPSKVMWALHDEIRKMIKEASDAAAAGKFIHIRYFAVRDAKGTYKGCLEVSQDVAAIRGLEGEKRLLNWE